MSRWRLAVVLLAAAGYALLAHWLTLQSAGRPWALAGLIGPIWSVGVLIAARRRQWLALAALAAVALAVTAIVMRGGIGDVNRLYVLQHAGIHLVLSATFALSLRPGRVSLIGAVATRVHGTLTPAMLAYSRRVTAAWAIYFVLMALLSVWVYAASTWAAWSLLANLATPLAIASLFVGEYGLRYWLHPEFERATLMDAVRAYSQNQAAP
jgi:uncharacterized membrane protein